MTEIAHALPGVKTETSEHMELTGTCDFELVVIYSCTITKTILVELDHKVLTSDYSRFPAEIR